MADKIVIRPVGKDERTAWEPLWDGYLAFYKATLAPGASDVAWQRFHDPNEPMFRWALTSTASSPVSSSIFFTARAGPREITVTCKTCLSPKMRAASASDGR